VTGSCGHDTEPSGCINSQNFLRGADSVSNRTPKVVNVHRMANGRLAGEDRNAVRVAGPAMYLVVIMVICTLFLLP
jgi:hypothetical protein